MYFFQRSGLWRRVIASDWDKRHPFILAWSPENNTSGTFFPSHSLGLVYWGYSKRLFSKLQDKKSVTKVFDELSKRYSSRKGGYSRVLKAGFRTGDDAPMAVIELVDRNPEAKKVDKPKKTETKDKKKEAQPEPKVASK